MAIGLCASLPEVGDAGQHGKGSWTSTVVIHFTLAQSAGAVELTLPDLVSFADIAHHGAVRLRQDTNSPSRTIIARAGWAGGCRVDGEAGSVLGSASDLGRRHHC